MAAAYGHCIKGLPVNALVSHRGMAKRLASCQVFHLACVIGFGETKKPRNSSPPPRPLLAHVTHTRIIEPKAALALRPKKEVWASAEISVRLIEMQKRRTKRKSPRQEGDL